MRYDKVARASALAAAVLAFGLTLGACEDGAMENAGERADEAVEDAGDKVEDATD